MPERGGQFTAQLTLKLVSPPVAITSHLQHIVFVYETSQPPPAATATWGEGTRLAWQQWEAARTGKATATWPSAAPFSALAQLLVRRDMPDTTTARVPVSWQQRRGLGLEQTLSRDGQAMWQDPQPAAAVHRRAGGMVAPSLPCSNAAPAMSPDTGSALWLELPPSLGEGAVTLSYQWMKAVRLICAGKERCRSQEVSAHTFAVRGHCPPRPWPAATPPLSHNGKT